MNHLFTSGDRVLLHLLMKGTGSDGMGGTADQDDIAAYCGVGRTHVPRALKPLITDGLVEESQGRAPGRVRRVKVYSLTSGGVAAAIALRDKANEEMIEWSDPNGEPHREPCVDALRRINDHLGACSLNRIPISLFLTVGRDRISWNDILFLSSSVKPEASETLCLPAGWMPVSPPAPAREIIDRPGEVLLLKRLIEDHPVCALAGRRGAGKRTLVSLLSERYDLSVLWLARGGDREYCIDDRDQDLIVIVDAPIVDVSSTLIGGRGVRLQDPRDGDWPGQLSAVPILGILDGTLEMECDAVMSLGGLDSSYFISAAVELGLPEELAGEYFNASKGVPLALAYLRELRPSVLSGLGTLDTEAALMSLMLGLGSMR